MFRRILRTQHDVIAVFMISYLITHQAEHDNMRTYYFCAETQDEMRQWMNAMSLASILQRDPR